MHNSHFSSTSSRRSTLYTLQRRLTRPPVDTLLEQTLAYRIDRILYTHAHAPVWTLYAARFTVHFVKGIFAGAGMYTMNAVLARQHNLEW
jgi:hypothetical protein